MLLNVCLHNISIDRKKMNILKLSKILTVVFSSTIIYRKTTLDFKQMLLNTYLNCSLVSEKVTPILNYNCVINLNNGLKQNNNKHTVN